MPTDDPKKVTEAGEALPIDEVSEAGAPEETLAVPARALVSQVLGAAESQEAMRGVATAVEESHELENSAKARCRSAAVERAPALLKGCASGRRLAESALYCENSLQHGHSEVWGSWYDTVAHCWGYRCCHGLRRDWLCPVAPRQVQPSEPKEPAQVGEAEDPASAASCEGCGRKVSVVGIEGLQPRSSFADSVDFVLHWVRAVLCDWREALRQGLPQVLAHERFGTWEQLGDAERAVAPLLRLLEACSVGFSLGEAVQVWSVGNNKWMRGKVLEVLASGAIVAGSKTSADGTRLPAGSVLVSFSAGDARKWISAASAGSLLRKPDKVELGKEAIEKLERIAALSTEREYHAANQAYIGLTLGHGRWHGDLSISGLTGCNKAPRNGFKVKRDQNSFLDTEEAMVYMFCLKRLVNFLQLIRPNTDVSKHCT